MLKPPSDEAYLEVRESVDDNYRQPVRIDNVGYSLRADAVAPIKVRKKMVKDHIEEDEGPVPLPEKWVGYHGGIVLCPHKCKTAAHDQRDAASDKKHYRFLELISPVKIVHVFSISMSHSIGDPQFSFQDPKHEEPWTKIYKHFNS